MIKKQIMFIGDYLLSFPGGAERSIYHVLKELAKKNEIKAITFDPKHSEGEFDCEGIHVINYGLKTDLGLSRFITTYCINERFFYKKLEQNIDIIKKSEYIVVQALFGPIAADFCMKNNIPYHYYLRDENQLNIFNNYEIGVRKILKIGKNIIELRAIKKYKKMNVKALKNAKQIVCNSSFIAKELKKRFGMESKIVFPKIDNKSLLKIRNKSKNREFITFIGGGNAMKGYDITLKIAKNMPEQKFLIIGPYNEELVKNNITFMPWQKDLTKILLKTRLILVPSRCSEAFGRVAVEASLAGIPAITSNRGGLPEANKNKKNIIKEIDNIQEWIGRIKSNLSLKK